MVGRNEHYLYDAASFLDRSIPTRNDIVNVDEYIFGGNRPALPEGESYESRLRRFMASLPLQGEPSQQGSLADRIAKHKQAVADFQKRVELAKMAGISPDQKFSYIESNVDQSGAVPFRIPSDKRLAPVMDDFALQNMKAEAAARVAGRTRGAVAAGPKSQIDAINAQTMRNATGKAQEVETMSDLQKMAQAYFGGRTQEQKQKEAFMNIAAGLAAGKSPRFMDNLGGAVSGAINFNRDDTNRREKEALAGMIDIQRLDDARSNNATENEIQRERNSIDRARAGASSKQANLYASYYATAARQARAARDKIDPAANPEAYALYDKQLNDAEAGYMAAVASGGGAESFVPPTKEASADIVYEKVGSGLKEVGKK